MALSTARIHRVRGRPPLLAAGIISLIHSHSSSVRSLGYIFSFIYPFYTTHEDFSDRLLETLGFDPYIATGRQQHHVPQAEAPEMPSTTQERMAAKVRTPEGKALYARRKVIVEPVFGQIKEARGFRRFLLRGLENIRGEWRLVCLTHNLLKIWRYGRVLLAA